MKLTIIGAGVAGPALGMFLRRAGIEAVVCEARDEAALQQGAFLTLAPNGMRVLEQLGLKEQIQALGEITHGMRFGNARGERVGEIDNRDCPARYGASLLTIERAALQRALLDACRRQGVELKLDRRLASFEQGDQVIARFEDGSHEASDLLIGCDGIRSRVRAQLFPTVAPKFTGLYDFGGITSYQGEDLEPGWFSMTFGKRAFFGVLRGQRDQLMWFHNGGSRPDDDARAHLLALHGEDPPFLNAIIARTHTILGPWPQHDILSLSRWHHGRVALIGDAAHAMTPSAGQGASIALEDAALLARCLRDGPSTAFEDFTTLRRKRVQRIVAASRHNGSGKAPSSAAAAWFRDRMLSTFLKLGASAQHEAIGYDARF